GAHQRLHHFPVRRPESGGSPGTGLIRPAARQRTSRRFSAPGTDREGASDMADGFDLVIVGMGSGGMVAVEFAATLGLKVAVAERGRVGGDCLWTGCVPSKALIASGKIAHHMRTADQWGIEPATPTVDRSRVWDRIRSVQQQVASTDDNPDRFRDMGV